MSAFNLRLIKHVTDVATTYTTLAAARTGIENTRAGSVSNFFGDWDETVGGGLGNGFLYQESMSSMSSIFYLNDDGFVHEFRMYTSWPVGINTTF